MHRLVAIIIGLLLALGWSSAARGQFRVPPPHVHETPCIDGQCQPNTFNYGFYQTHWRRWPTSLPRVDAGPAPRGRGLESLPRVETPDPRFEGEISPPHGPAAPPPPDRPANTPEMTPELPPPQAPAPELPDPFLPNPRGSRLPSQERMGERLDAPPVPPAFSSLSTPRPDSLPNQPAAFLGGAAAGPLPPREVAQHAHSTANEIRLTSHEQPVAPTSGIELRIIRPQEPAPGATSPEPQMEEIGEYLIEEEAAPPSPIAFPPPPVVRAPASRPKPSKANRPISRSRDQLFESLRVARPARDPLFEAIP